MLTFTLASKHTVTNSENIKCYFHVETTGEISCIMALYYIRLTHTLDEELLHMLTVTGNCCYKHPLPTTHTHVFFTDHYTTSASKASNENFHQREFGMKTATVTVACLPSIRPEQFPGHTFTSLTLNVRHEVGSQQVPNNQLI